MDSKLWLTKAPVCRKAIREVHVLLLHYEAITKHSSKNISILALVERDCRVSGTHSYFCL